MNLSKIGLFLLMSTAATIALCDKPLESNEPLATSYTMRVGDYLEIPIGPIVSGYEPIWQYKVMNPEQVYAHLNQTTASNILEDGGWTEDYTGSIFEYFLGLFTGSNVLTQFQRIKAVKPGTTTIIYNRVQTLDGCDCDKLRHWEKIGRAGNVWERGSWTKEFDDCKVACENEAAQQATKVYKTVTITVLPAE